MSIRIGLAAGFWSPAQVSGEFLWEFIDAAEAQGWDSLWFSDRITGSPFVLEVMTVMAAVAGRTRKLKFGPSVLAQSLRNPVITAKELATIDLLSGGRLLPAVGLGGEAPLEYEACGLEKRERAARVEEAVPLMRRLWLEESVTHQGRFYHLRDVSLYPKPVQQPPPIWVGGRSHAALERVGRIGDGWLASNITPQEVAQGIPVIQETAQRLGRKIEDDHYGVLLTFKLTDDGSNAEQLLPYLATRRSDVPLEACTAAGSPEYVKGRIEEYLEAGASKFVMRPACPPQETVAQMERFAREVLPVFHAR